MRFPFEGRWRLAVVAVLAALAAAPSGAQEYSRIEDTQAQAPGYFFYARPGEPVVAVTAVGGINAPGRYLLGVGAEVGDLVALAGGGLAASTGGAQGAAVRVYRASGIALDVPLGDLYTAAGRLALEDGDVVEVTALTTTATGYFLHARSLAGAITVTAAGTLGAPGLYVVDASTTVGDLVALAGGAADRERDAETTVTKTVRVYRDGQTLLETSLSNLYIGQTPTLMAGDVVDLEVVTLRRTPFTWRDGVSVVTSVVTVLLAAERLVFRN